MDIKNGKTIRQLAAQKLSQAKYCPRKLVLIHTGAALGLSVLLTVLNFILTRQIDTTGGLSGLGSRAILETAQTMLQYASFVLLPFWELGFVFAALGLAREQEVTPGSLLEGFRRFFPALRLMLLRLVLCFAVGLACANISATIYALTPQAAEATALIEPLLTADSAQDMQLLMEQLPLDEMSRIMLPAWIIFGALYALVMIPVLYRLRMADFVLMDAPKTGAFAALRGSFRITRRNCWKLFRLDLGFWWFYLLEGVVALLCYGDVLADTLRLSLPVSGNTRFFLFYIVYALCQLALHVFAWAKVQTTYAVAYDMLLQQSGETPQPAAKPVPWNYE